MCVHFATVYRSRCEYPPARGPCKAKITRWYYNARLKNCNSFIWGGCSGNKNNFIDYKTCMKSCDATITSVSLGDGDGELGTTFLPGCIGEFGCCNDGVTSAKGPDQEGCPSKLKIIIVFIYDLISKHSAFFKCFCLFLTFII